MLVRVLKNLVSGVIFIILLFQKSRYIDLSDYHAPEFAAEVRSYTVIILSRIEPS